MDSYAPFSRIFAVSLDAGLLHGIGSALRKAFGAGARPPATTPTISKIEVAKQHHAEDFEAAAERVRRSASNLKFVSALTINPPDKEIIDRGIHLVLRRIEADFAK